MSRRVVRPNPADAPDVGAADHAVLSQDEWAARGLAAILTVREWRHGDKAAGPPRCLRCHRELTGKVKPFRGIGRDCWRTMLRIKATDPDAPTMPTGPDYVLVRDRQGRLHHNVPAGYRVPKGSDFYGPPSLDPLSVDSAVMELGASILRSTGLVNRSWIPNLAGMFYDEFLRDVPDDGTIIRGADVLAWIMEHTRRGDA